VVGCVCWAFQPCWTGFIQQAVLQVLQPAIDPTLLSVQLWFRPGRSAHDAVCRAQRYVQEDRHWVVDADLAQFFDRVNHDILMGKVATRITDPRVLTLIRRYLEAGVLASGVVMERHEGTPQGGPLSPLLANVFARRGGSGVGATRARVRALRR